MSGKLRKADVPAIVVEPHGPDPFSTDYPLVAMRRGEFQRIFDKLKD